MDARASPLVSLVTYVFYARPSDYQSDYDVDDNETSLQYEQ